MDESNQRSKKTKKNYADDWDEEDDELEEARMWSLEEKLASDRYNASYVEEFETGENFTLKYFQEYGFKKPMRFQNKAGLGIRVPSENFSVNDVKQCVGASRLVDVMDVNTQKALVMKMRDWCLYFNEPVRERLLNVISLEFSHTKLDHYVESPTIVRQVDWLDRAWPLYLRDKQTDSTNDLEKMKYPKVRKYVLMSVAGCYTDFHIDFGGTSVWYHILRGEKVFWLIPPTEKNVSRFEQWCLSGKQGDNFFPDLVDGCQRVHLSAGHTFMIPTGWIHGVYTPADSLVFGGNFLHTFGVPLQFRVWQVEDKTHVKLRFRYPYYTELHWYVLARYLSCLTGKEYVVEDTEEEKSKVEDGEEVPPAQTVAVRGPSKDSLEWQYITPFELEGLRRIIRWVQSLPSNRRFCPGDIHDREGLLKDAQRLVDQHADDDPKSAITNQPLLKWPANAEKPRRGRGSAKWGSGPGKARKEKRPVAEGGPKRRRMRCKRCEPCRRDNCRDCIYCRDMIKYGGHAILKQCCIQKQCIAPLLPTTAVCGLCCDGGRATEEEKEADDYKVEGDLMECGICWDIVHPRCLLKAELEAERELTEEGVVNEDLPNYWECPKCIREGKRGWLKPRVPKGLAVLRVLENAAVNGRNNGTTADGDTPARPAPSTGPKKRGRPPRNSAGQPRAKKRKESSDFSESEPEEDIDDADQIQSNQFPAAVEVKPSQSTQLTSDEVNQSDNSALVEENQSEEKAPMETNLSTKVEDVPEVPKVDDVSEVPKVEDASIASKTEDASIASKDEAVPVADVSKVESSSASMNNSVTEDKVSPEESKRRGRPPGAKNKNGVEKSYTPSSSSKKPFSLAAAFATSTKEVTVIRSSRRDIQRPKRFIEDDSDV